MGNSYEGGYCRLTYLRAQKAAQHFKNIQRRFIMSSPSTWEVRYV